MSLKEYLAELSDLSKPLVVAELLNLSDLSSEELELVIEAWTAIPLGRRQQVIDQLIILAEDNFDFSFNGIFRVCLYDPDVTMRIKAIEGLWDCEDCFIISPLIEVLENDSQESVRAAAATALGKFALLAELGKIRSHHAMKIKDALLGVISDEGQAVEVRQRAIEAISPISIPEVEMIIQEAYQSQNPKLHVSALYAMGCNCNPLWLPILLKELNSDIPEMRFEAARACGELGRKEALPHIVNLVRDGDIQVQLAAIETLGKIGGDEAKQALHECSRDSDEYVREVAKVALDELELEDD